MSEFNVQTRKINIEKASTPHAVYDICIVGGGITGAGIAREASLRGLKTIVLEKNDFAFGTSSRSSKLIHGGVRYLENLEFALVFESTQERARLWKNAPQLCHPLPFLFPSFKTSKVPLWKLNLGLWLYDLLATFRIPSRHKKYSAKKTHEVEPSLTKENLTGSIFYWDGATNDARLTLANIIEAHNLGANVISRCEAVSHNYSQEDKVHRIDCHDHLDNKTFQVKAKTVVCAAGPWSDIALKQLGVDRKSKLLAATRGSHFVVERQKLPLNHAIVIFHPTDQRVMFSIPWGDHTVVGTTDIFDEVKPDNVRMSADEVDYLIKAVKDYFPSCELTRKDILSVWSGLRPLIKPDDSESASKISREHHLEWTKEGILIIAGGKLTTFRRMSEDALYKLLNEARNNDIHLEYKKHISSKNIKIANLEFPNERKLGSIGTSEAGHLTVEDIKGICNSQMVLKLEDFMVRRTDLYYKEPNNGLDILEELKNPICEELDWDDARWNKEVEEYKNYLAFQLECLN